MLVKTVDNEFSHSSGCPKSKIQLQLTRIIVNHPCADLLLFRATEKTPFVCSRLRQASLLALNGNIFPFALICLNCLGNPLAAQTKLARDLRTLDSLAEVNNATTAKLLLSFSGRLASIKRILGGGTFRHA